MELKSNLFEFIEKANEVHNNKYDYSKSIYIGVDHKIEIICSEHGTFLQIPYNHLRGNGCPKCGITKRTDSSKLSIYEFIERANKIHNEKYDYTQSNYINFHTSIKIICQIHGEFWQKPSKHLSGQGCPKCGGRIKLTQQEFIKKAEFIHSNKYYYNESIYINIDTKLKIKCLIHGEFWQAPYEHLKGSGCRICGIIKRGKNKIKSNTKFIEEANKIHNNKYNYSKTKYENSKNKIKIICQIHEIFEQSAASHLSGSGCPKCGKVETASKLKLSIEEFKIRANKIHNNKYDYSKSIYSNIDTKIEIICPIHGSFQQIPYVHLNGHKCPLCLDKWTKEKISFYIESMMPYMDNMSQQELFAIFQQTGKYKSQILKAVQSSSPKKELTNLFNNKNPQLDINNSITEKLENKIKLEDPKELNSNIENTSLPNLDASTILNTLDNSISKLQENISSSIDEETIEYLKTAALNKLWKFAYQDEKIAFEEIENFLEKNNNAKL